MAYCFVYVIFFLAWEQLYQVSLVVKPFKWCKPHNILKSIDSFILYIMKFLFSFLFWTNLPTFSHMKNPDSYIIKLFPIFYAHVTLERERERDFIYVNNFQVWQFSLQHIKKMACIVFSVIVKLMTHNKILLVDLLSFISQNLRPHLARLITSSWRCFPRFWVGNNIISW